MATKVRQILSPLAKNQDSTYHFVNLNAFVDLSSITLKIHFRSQKPCLIIPAAPDYLCLSTYNCRPLG